MSNAYVIIPLLKKYNIQDIFKKIQDEIVKIEYEEYCNNFDIYTDSKCFYCEKWKITFLPYYRKKYYTFLHIDIELGVILDYGRYICCDLCIPKLIEDCKKNPRKFTDPSLFVDYHYYHLISDPYIENYTLKYSYNI